MIQLHLHPARLLIRLRRLLRNDQLLIALLAVSVGLLVGGAVVGFREAIAFAQRLSFGTGEERLYRAAATLPWWHLLAAPLAGAALVGLLVKWLVPPGQPQGVAQVIEAAALSGRGMGLRAGLAAAAAAAVAIGSGASVGREGPAVHLGATLATWLAARLRLGGGLTRSLLGCGAAAAVAASFNAPIAGALFAQEVVVGHYALSAFAPVVMSSVTATLVSRAWYGDFPAFAVPAFVIRSWLEYPVFAVLGVVAAVLAVVFMRGIAAVDRRVASLSWPAPLRPLLGGLTVGILALAYPQILGGGYEITDDALKGIVPLWLLFLLLLAKLLATTVSLGTGYSGGLFGPSLVLGALLGGAYGLGAAVVLPVAVSASGAYALAGMGAVAASVMGAPISTTLIMFELTGSYQVTVAVMLAAVVSSVVSQLLLGAPSFFVWQLRRRGSPAVTAAAFPPAAIRVGAVMKTDGAAVSAAAPLAEVRRHLLVLPSVFVLGDDGTVRGSIALADLGPAAFDPALDGERRAIDVSHPPPPGVTPQDDIATALDAMRKSCADCLPVMDAAAEPRFVGWLTRADALAACNRALLAARQGR